MPKIHLLPPLTDDPAEADVFPFDDDSVADPSSPQKTKKMTLAQHRDWLLSQISVANNLLLNGNMDIWQRATTFTPNDDTYIADRWNCLQEANASWTFARDTAVPSSGSRYALKCTNVTANNQAGIVQILEAADAAQLANQLVSLSFQAKTVGTEIAKLRCAILSWTGTEDVVTSDVVSAWGQNGTNPTWAANWTMENVPTDLALTATYQRFTIENVLIDTPSMKNVAVVIWVDDGTITAGDDFWVTQVQLNVGGTAGDFAPRPYSQEQNLVKRYYQRFIEPHMMGVVASSGTSISRMGLHLAIEMRVAPTLTISSNLPVFDGGGVATINGVSVNYHAPYRLQFDGSPLSATMGGNRPAVAYKNLDAVAVMLDAEL